MKIITKLEPIRRSSLSVVGRIDEYIQWKACSWMDLLGYAMDNKQSGKCRCNRILKAVALKSKSALTICTHKRTLEIPDPLKRLSIIVIDQFICHEMTYVQEVQLAPFYVRHIYLIPRQPFLNCAGMASSTTGCIRQRHRSEQRALLQKR